MQHTVGHRLIIINLDIIFAHNLYISISEISKKTPYKEDEMETTDRHSGRQTDRQMERRRQRYNAQCGLLLQGTHQTVSKLHGYRDCCSITVL